MSFINYNRALINENKWRAARTASMAKMIDFGKEMEVNTRALILELLDFVDDVVDDLGCREDLQYVHKYEHGNRADRQLAVTAKYNLPMWWIILPRQH